MKDGLVSIVFPCYNCEDFICESINSVLAQTYTNWELIICDDCSTDNTKNKIEPFLEDSRIHYFCMETNGGPAHARNLGLSNVNGDYVAFLDSDDIWIPDKLEKQIAFMKENSICFCCSGYEKISEDGSRLGIKLLPHKEIGYWKMFFLSNPIGNSTVIYDRRHFGEVRVPDIKKRNDFALWLLMLRNGEKCFGQDDVFAKYRVRKGSVSSSRMKLAKYHWQLYHHIEKRNVFVSLLGMLSWIFVKGTGIGLRIKKFDV